MTHDWRQVVRAHVPHGNLELETAFVDELAQHLADLYEEAIAGGHSDEEAVAIARAALPEDPRALAHDLATARRSLPGLIADRWAAPPEPAALASWKGRMMTDVRRDLVYAVRSLRRTPGYTVVVLLTLALGIGATVAIFSAVDTLLVRPMPFPNADRLVVPLSVHADRGGDNSSVSYADYADWRREAAIFEAVALWRPVTVDLTGAGQPERVRAVQVSADYFDVVNITQQAGRTLTTADHLAAAPRVTVISHGLWQRMFGGTADTVGRTIRVGGVTVEVVGVLPAHMAWPAETDLFVPLPSVMSEDTRTRRDNMIFFSIAKLRDGVNVEQASTVLRTIAARIESQFPDSRRGWSNRVQPLREYMVEDELRRALWILLAAAGTVLLIGCANLANLGLVRGLGRARELTVRLALGASRWRLVRQLAIECLLLSAAGAAAGGVLGAWLITIVARMAPEGTPFVDLMQFDARVLAATGVLALLSTLLVGLLPAIAASRVTPGLALKDGSSGTGSSRRVRVLRQGLIVAEVAGAVVLLCGAALLLRSFWRLQQVDPGVDADRIVTARLSLPRAPRYSTSAQSSDFFARLIDRLNAAPGVESAGATSFVPIGGGGFGLGRVFLGEGWVTPPAGPDVSAQWNVVTPGYFRTIGIPLLAGRTFAPEDRGDSTPVVIVSRSFAKQAFGEADPLGRRIRSWRDENLLREIVGVVDEVRYMGLAERDVVRQVYVPHTQNSWGLMNIVVRSAAGPPAALAPMLRREVAALDADLAVSNLMTLNDIAGESVAEQRSTMWLLAVLAMTALALSAIGIYGVVSHAVSMRRRELAVRAALGGSPRHLYFLVMGEGLRMTAVGLVIGVAGAIAGSRLLEALLFDTASRDPMAFGATIGLIAIVAALACVGPARRAARLDPLSALKVD